MPGDTDKDSKPGNDRWTSLLSMGFTVVLLAIVGVMVLAVTIVIVDPDSGQNVFNVIVPVIAAWVGTVLAFYYGRQNFQTANEEIREMVRELGPDDRARQPVTAIMKPAWNMTSMVVDGNGSAASLTLRELKAKYVGNVSRLPVLGSDRSALYMIHESRVDRHVAEGGSIEDTLETFVATQAADTPPVQFDYGHGFLTVPENATVADVKHELVREQSVQDVFVTRSGRPDGEVLGWVSNIRLARYLPV